MLEVGPLLGSEPVCSYLKVLMPYWFFGLTWLSIRSFSEGIRLEVDPPLLLTRLPENTINYLLFEII